ncbi:hypothetical protein CDAR_419361 [Caerostris darwini]|uniref:Uncharacterized protein n=1 Tax=Caerostris darwini TaxID=1538125 RepID=A0AAV4T2F6_9ARAC|nr:hypothetical protein CDAR_419361 [Caerostris darwini]
MHKLWYAMTPAAWRGCPKISKIFCKTERSAKCKQGFTSRRTTTNFFYVDAVHSKNQVKKNNNKPTLHAPENVLDPSLIEKAVYVLKEFIAIFDSLGGIENAYNIIKNSKRSIPKTPNSPKSNECTQRLKIRENRSSQTPSGRGQPG